MGMSARIGVARDVFFAPATMPVCGVLITWIKKNTGAWRNNCAYPAFLALRTFLISLSLYALFGDKVFDAITGNARALLNERCFIFEQDRAVL